MDRQRFRRLGIFIAAGTIGWVVRGIVATANGQTVACTPATCEIHMEQVAVLTDADVVGEAPRNSIYVVEDRPGRFLLISAKRNGIISFGGSQAARVLGVREPGQQVLVSIIPSPDGRSYVFDAVTGSRSVLLADGSLAEALPFPYAPSFALPSGDFVVAQQIRSRDLIGYPLHVIDASGRVLRSFGVDTPEYRRDLERLTTRLATPGRDGTIWTVAPGRYLLEQWSPADGVRQRSIRVRADWFTESRRPDDPAERPTPVIEALWERDRFLWALIRVADLNWSPPQGPTAERPLDPDEYDARFDWVLEAIDPVSGAIVAHRRFERALWGRSSASPLLARLLPAGRPGLEVLTFGVRRKE